MKAKQDTTNVASHFLRRGQFLGLDGSVGEDHVTYRTRCYSLVLLLGLLEGEAALTRFGTSGDPFCSSAASLPDSLGGGVCFSKSEVVLATD